MIDTKTATQWFVYSNPTLNKYIDSNTKVNKLLYFSNLMYFSLTQNSLFDESFVAFPNGPVLYSVYVDYRYNGLYQCPVNQPRIQDKLVLKIFEIVNFLYGGKSVEQLIDESHTHNIWDNVKSKIPGNPIVEFERCDDAILSYYKSLFNLYKSIDFNNIVREEIKGNTIFYDKTNITTLTESIIDEVAEYPSQNEPFFLEIIDDELIVS